DAVCRIDGLDSSGLLDLLSRLVTKPLVIVQPRRVRDTVPIAYAAARIDVDGSPAHAAFVGREAKLERLTAAFETACGGDGSLVSGGVSPPKSPSIQGSIESQGGCGCARAHLHLWRSQLPSGSTFYIETSFTLRGAQSSAYGISRY